MQMEAVVARSSSTAQANKDAGLTQDPAAPQLGDEQIAHIRNVDAERKAVATLNERPEEAKKTFDLAQLKNEHPASGINETAAEHVRLLRERAGISGDVPESVEKAVALVMHHARAARTQDNGELKPGEVSAKPADTKKDDDLLRPLEARGAKPNVTSEPTLVNTVTNGGRELESPKEQHKPREELGTKPQIRALPALDPELEASLQGALDEVGKRWQQALKKGPEGVNSLAA